MKRWSITVLLCLFMVSCAGGLANPVKRQAAFDDNEYLPYTKPGKAVITGQAFSNTKGGEVRYAAGRTVYLHPATSYATEYFNIQVVLGSFMTNPDQRFLQFEKKTVSDATGNFEFKNLPAGKYYVVTEFGWCAGRNAQYIVLGALIEAKEGETIKIILPVVRNPLFLSGPAHINCW
jgi:hypothetical protein